MDTYLILSIFMILFMKLINSNPITTGQTLKIEVPSPELIKFMRKYGYLDDFSSDSESIYHESAIINGIKNVQKYGALNQTGILDQETLKLMSSPRCGVADISSYRENESRKKRYIVGGKHWQKRNLKYFIANWIEKVPEDKIVRDMKAVFDIWSNYSNLKFKRIYDPSADIVIGFGSHFHGDNYPFDGPGNVLAHAFYPYEMANYGGDIHFDADENWKENSTDLLEGVDFFSVALHELGHSLGLSHSPVYSSIMFPYYKGPLQSTLDYDDILAMYNLYIRTNLMEENESEEESTSRHTEFTTMTYKDIEEITVFPTTYEGDYENVEHHKTRNGNVPILPQINETTIENIPNICLGSFDSVMEFRANVYIFKENYVWRLTENYRIMEGYPIKISEMFPFLPDTIRIDAAYERSNDNAVLLFQGSQYWIYDGRNLIGNGPRSISDFGIPENITKLNAALYWPKNQKTYLFGENQFWRFDDQLQQLDDGYPLGMERWIGIPENIDAAASIHSKTYFFKDNLYWLYNDKFVRPERGYPRKSSNAWLGCPVMQRRRPLRNYQNTVFPLNYYNAN